MSWGIQKPKALLVKAGASVLFFMFQACLTVCAQETPAFPTAEGFGAYAKGGRGGDVYHVVNLEDDGPGSLRFGVEEAKGPRTIVFDVSGTIMLEDRLKLDEPFMTIAGQTAPGDGITLGGNSFDILASDIIVRYIRCRYGDLNGEDRDAVSINSGTNIIIDHVTASWSVDETFSCQSGDVDLLTVQWCMITESLRDSHHAKGEHGYGGIIGSVQQSFHHNLYAHHSSRSPKVTGRRHCEVDFRNNVIYNWGYNSCYDGTKSYLNWVNNYYKAGPATEARVRSRIFELSDEMIPSSNEGWELSNTFTTSLFAEGNFVEGNPGVTADNWSGGIDFDNGASEENNRVLTPAFVAPAITEQSAFEAYPLVLAGAGASHQRDIIDMRIVDEVETGTATFGNSGLIDSQADVGAWPAIAVESRPGGFDSDQDGMPDAWEADRGLDVNYASDRNGDDDADGYTNLEEYLNSIVAVDSELAANRFELWQLRHFDSNKNGALEGSEIVGSKRLDDFDGDGFSNEYEFFFGMDPQSRLNIRGPRLSLMELSGKHYSLLTYTKWKEGNGIRYEELSCEDLKT